MKNLKIDVNGINERQNAGKGIISDEHILDCIRASAQSLFPPTEYVDAKRIKALDVVEELGRHAMWQGVDFSRDSKCGWLSYSKAVYDKYIKPIYNEDEVYIDSFSFGCKDDVLRMYDIVRSFDRDHVATPKESIFMGKPIVCEDRDEFIRFLNEHVIFAA